MKKRFWLRMAEALVFVVLIAAAFVMVSDVLVRKESRNLLGGFLEEPENYDVLFFGDSKLVTSVVPMEMWEEYGIAGYNLACYSALMPVSYWTLINALDYAQPELAVFSVNGFTEEKKVSHYSPDVHTEMDFWPLTRNKVRMINDLMDNPENPDIADWEGNLYRNLKWEFLFPIGKFHGRWSELGKGDFEKRPRHVKGGEFMVGIEPIWEYTLTSEEDYADEVGYAFSYLRMAIEECRSRGIEVLLLHLPSPIRVNSQRYANTARSIAQEYGVNFVDATQLDSIVDYAVDCFDTDPHLNTAGTLKMTSFLGSYMRAHYDLPDRRGEEKYAHWDELLEAHKDEKMRVLGRQEELNNILMLLHDRDYDVDLFLSPDAPVWYDDLSIVLMHNIVRERVLAGEEYDKYSNFMFPLEGFDKALSECTSYYLHREDGVWQEYTGEAAEKMADQTFGEEMKSEIAIEVRDARSAEVVKQMQF